MSSVPREKPPSMTRRLVPKYLIGTTQVWVEYLGNLNWYQSGGITWGMLEILRDVSRLVRTESVSSSLIWSRVPIWNEKGGLESQTATQLQTREPQLEWQSNSKQKANHYLWQQCGLHEWKSSKGSVTGTQHGWRVQTVWPHEMHWTSWSCFRGGDKKHLGRLSGGTNLLLRAQ